MDFSIILQVLITSVTSVIVALIGAGYFKKYSDTKKEKFSKTKLMEQIKKDEIVHLVTQLLGCRNPYVCPRGKPVYFEIPKRDFETRFKRKL